MCSACVDRLRFTIAPFLAVPLLNFLDPALAVAVDEGTLDGDDGGTLDADDSCTLDASVCALDAGVCALDAVMCTLGADDVCEPDRSGGAVDADVKTAPGSVRTSPLVAVSVAFGGSLTTPAGSRYVKPTSVMSMISKDS